MKSLLILNKKQFGYHTDTYELSNHLKNSFRITYLCFDNNLPKYNVEGINVIYIPSKSNFIKRGFYFLKTCINEIKNDYDYFFLIYFSFCSAIKIFSKKEIILDFRTGSVQKNKIKRKIDNKLRSIEAKVFSRISIISEGLQSQLKIPNRKVFIFPLGANVISKKSKQFETPKLFYIGTFNNRNIEDSIKGVRLFLNNNPQYKYSLTYDIVGSGYKNEEELFRKLIFKHSLQENVILHGRKKHSEIQNLFDHCNIGISYIPITEYFDFQPPTKTFEYILSGMFCLATRTFENKKYIKAKNGLLCDDNPNSFTDALEQCVNKFDSINSNIIRNTLKNYSWSNLSKEFKQYLLNGN